MKHKPFLIAAYLVGAAMLLAVVMYGLVLAISDKARSREGSGIKTKFDELEFVVVHRPQLTYLVDIKYLVCFATHKPAYQDLVEFRCPDRLLQEASGQFLKPVPKKEKRK